MFRKIVAAAFCLGVASCGVRAESPPSPEAFQAALQLCRAGNDQLNDAVRAPGGDLFRVYTVATDLRQQCASAASALAALHAPKPCRDTAERGLKEARDVSAAFADAPPTALVTFDAYFQDFTKAWKACNRD